MFPNINEFLLWWEPTCISNPILLALQRHNFMTQGFLSESDHVKALNSAGFGHGTS